MSNSILLAALNANTAVAAGSVLPLGVAIHGYGRGIILNGNSIQLKEAGYYRILLNTSAAVTGTGALTIQMYQNGVAVPGAAATETPGAAGSVVNISLPWVIRKTCCCDDTVITFQADVAGTAQHVIVEVEKL